MIFRVNYSGKNNLILLPLRCSKKNKVVIGHNNYIGNNCHFGADVLLKNHIMVANSVSFVGGDHVIDSTGTFMHLTGRGILKGIIVESDVWIGHGAIILDGVIIGRGAVVGAGSVVTRNILPYTIVAGNPAKKIRDRFDEDDIVEHEKALDKIDPEWK